MGLGKTYQRQGMVDNMPEQVTALRVRPEVRRIYKAAAADLGITIMALLARLTQEDNAAEVAALQAAARRVG